MAVDPSLRLEVHPSRRTAVLASARLGLRAVFSPRARNLVLAVCSLAIGMGVAIAGVNVIGSLLSGEPGGVRAPEQVNMLPALGTYADLDALTAGVRQAEVAGYTRASATFAIGADSVSVNLECVTPNFFAVLGVRPSLGRLFDAADALPDAMASIVLADGTWRRFGEAVPPLARGLSLDGRPYVAIGVTPAEFHGLELDSVDGWVLMTTAPDLCTADHRRQLRESSIRSVQIILRLNQAESAPLWSEIGSVLRATRPTIDAPAPKLMTVGEMRRRLLGRSGTVGSWIVAGALLVFLMACANTAGLLAIRVFDRSREIRIRSDLGATRAMVFVQFLAEHLTVVLISCGLAWFVAFALQRFAATVLSNEATPIGSTHWLWSLGAFALLAFALAGIFPALQASAQVALSRSVFGASSWRKLRLVLVVTQAGIAMLLAVCGLLFQASLENVLRNPGYDTDHLKVIHVDLERAGLTTSGEIGTAIQNIQRTLTALKGISSVSISYLPLLGSGGPSVAVPIKGAGNTPAPVVDAVSNTYFETVGTRVLRGRSFDAADTLNSAPVVIVDETLAKALWPREDALGNCVALTPRTCLKVVGVTESRRHIALAQVRGELFLPASQASRYLDLQPKTILTRTTDREPASDTAILTALRGVLGPRALVTVYSVTDLAMVGAKPWSLGAKIFGGFGILAMSITAVGVFSLLVFTVKQQRKEIGIRMALGADRQRVVLRVFSAAARLLITGIAVGGVGALLTAQSLRALLFGIAPVQPASFAAGAALVMSSGVVAAIWPALLASRIDPTELIREP